MIFADNFHIKIVAILFITTLIIIVLKLKEDFVVNRFEAVIPATTDFSSKVFSLGHRSPVDNHFLGWKNFWNLNYNHSAVTLENSYKNSPYEEISKDGKLMYDGVRNL
tara:strand:- start:1389 stop:1712 length:324 start_codon:yes stop_codon:yes gene_type:complete